MTNSTLNSKILDLRLALINYPILAETIREDMRRELFSKGIVTPALLEKEVESKAIESQELEGLTDPMHQESEETWQRRLLIVRDYLTDFYFAYNLPHSRFEEIVKQAVTANRTDTSQKFILSFNPELSPWYLLFEQGEKYATYPPELFEHVKHNLRQIIVVLLKSLVSDQLAFVRIARDFMNIFDLKEIKANKIGKGKIGGKSAGMMLAYKILGQPDPDDEVDLSGLVTIPETYFLGSDVYYDFKALNDLEYTISQKYRSHDEIEQQYPLIREAYLKGRFSADIIDELHKILVKMGDYPFIVRSSSLLEDNFGSAFAGKYDSFFLPNQGTPQENLEALSQAIIRIYASVLSPDALFYRQIQGLEDYDERMAVLIQKVQGERHGKYFLPYIGGVGFSRNPFIWNKKLNPEDGFLRIVFGLGTRAVDRVDRDYPRMVGLSHPQLRPEKNAADIIKYSQRMVDVIDLEENVLKSIPVSHILSDSFPAIQYLASIDEGNYVKPISSLGVSVAPERLVLTFDSLLKNSDFATVMKTILKKLEKHYKRPVDIEFTVTVIPEYPKPRFEITLLQCRPLSNQEWTPDIKIPTHVAVADQLFTATHLVPQGIIDRIRYIVYVNPNIYSQIPKNRIRIALAHTIGQLNKELEGENFILMGPGRWGSSNIDLGIKVSYADIYNARMLIEIALAHNGITPEASYGTHFFQDLVESKIFPLALYPDNPEILFNQALLDASPNILSELLPDQADYADYVKVIDLPQTNQGKLLRVVMSTEEGRALAYLNPC